ncbi:MAG: flagellin, partial [Planctomycetota bacterium]
MKITNANYLGTIRALGQARSDQNLALRRLSSGLRVEKGIDGPAALIASQTLRAERASLEQASQTASRATGLVDVADAALDAMGQAARKLEQLFLESRGIPLSPGEQKAIQEEADGLIRHIDHLSETTVYAGRRVFKEDPTFGIDQPPGNIGEFNIATGDHNWQVVNFIESYNNPIVVAGPTSSNGADPNHVRLRNVTSTGFEFRIEEYGNYDGVTPAETFGWMVMEQGIHTLADGTLVEAGQVQVDHVIRTYSFASPDFTTAPLLFSTLNGDLPSAAI